MAGGDWIADALDAGRIGAWRWHLDTDRLEWSSNLLAIHRRAADTFRGTFADFAEDIHSDDRERVLATVQGALAVGGDYEVQYRLPVGDEDGDIWIEAKGRVLTDAGRPVGMLGTCQDVTARKRLGLELAARLRQQEGAVHLGRTALETEELQRLFDSAVSLLAETLDADYAKVLELTPSRDLLLLRAGTGWAPGLVGTASVGTGADSQAGYTLQTKGPVLVDDLAGETRFHGPQLLIDHGVVSGISTVIAGPDGKPFGVLGVHVRRPRHFTQYDLAFLQSVANILGGAVQNAHARSMQAFVLHELRHRVGNLFMQLLSVHEQTARSSADKAEMVRKYRDRVLAVAAAHEVVSREGGISSSMHALLEKLLAPFSDRTALDGASAVQLPADTALALGMVISELAMNASKYGCFAEPAGRLRVGWQTVGDGAAPRLRLEWQESCSRPILPPQRTSFGSRLIGGLVERQLQGRLSREFRPTGLHVDISLPLPGQPSGL
ncbi:MAG: sensor histidine kinase [Alphaproteobacteria bacterium]